MDRKKYATLHPMDRGLNQIGELEDYSIYFALLPANMAQVVKPSWSHRFDLKKGVINRFHILFCKSKLIELFGMFAAF